jgi:ribonuclease HI
MSTLTVPDVAVAAAAEEQRLLVYTDGGARPNPGNAGWGLHGYLYHPSVPKKGSGNPNHILTDQGYVTKEEAKLDPKLKQVTPISYIDGFGSFATPMTNNVAELVAARHALQFALEHVVTRVSIWTDSEYVKNGMTSWVKSWVKYGWRRQDGSPITNVEDWKALCDLRDQLLARGCKVEFNWIKGHNDHLGNELSDAMATLGVMHSKQGVVHNEIIQHTADGYWKYDTNANPFLSLPALYFNTRLDAQIDGEYYIGNQYKELDLLGKRVSDGAFAVVRLKAPDPAIEAMQKHAIKLSSGTDNIMMLRLDQLFRADTHAQVCNWGHLATDQPNPHAYDLDCLDGEPMARHVRKARLAYRAVENISELSQKLDEYLQGAKEIITTDLTPYLYETIVKTDKKGGTSSSMQLKEEHQVGLASIEVVANYAVNSETGEYYSVPLILTLGIDLLDRNKLKRLEGRDPKVTLITWMESDVSFRHATVIQAGEDIGIWAGMYSNIRLLPMEPISQPASV